MGAEEKVEGACADPLRLQATVFDLPDLFGRLRGSVVDASKRLVLNLDLTASTCLFLTCGPGQILIEELTRK